MADVIIEQNGAHRERITTATTKTTTPTPTTTTTHFALLDDLSIEDLEHSEKELCFYELVSLGFLLFGNDQLSAEYILQKLVILSKQEDRLRELVEGFLEGEDKEGVEIENPTSNLLNADILCTYARLNPKTWRSTIIEALTIVRCRRVLRRLGFDWTDVRAHYLPHVPQLTVNINRKLKILYNLCEQLTLKQTKELIDYIHAEYLTKRLGRCVELNFNNHRYLEVYLLYWISQRLIRIDDKDRLGEQQTTVKDLQPLFDHFQRQGIKVFQKLLDFTVDKEEGNGMNSNPAEKRSIEEVEGNTLEKAEVMAGEVEDTLLEAEVMTVEVGGNILQEDQVKAVNVVVVEESEDLQDNDEGSTQITHHIWRFIKYIKNSSLRLTAMANDRYLVRHSSAGYLLIINQNQFYEETDSKLKHLLPAHPFPRCREGTDIDRDRLSYLFGYFGYESVIVENVNHTQMLKEIHAVVEKSVQKDSLIVAILTHGAKDVVYGNNSIPVYLNDIQQIMSSSCLKGKPKMLIIQACQKETITTLLQSNRAMKPTTVDDSYADMLVAMSALPGSEALRNTLLGSWYIEALCNVLNKYGRCKHIVDILTIVTNAVTHKNQKNEFMLPLFRSTLRKNFYLPNPPSASKKDKITETTDENTPPNV